MENKTVTIHIARKEKKDAERKLKLAFAAVENLYKTIMEDAPCLTKAADNVLGVLSFLESAALLMKATECVFNGVEAEENPSKQKGRAVNI